MRILFTRFPYESAKGGAELQTKWLATGLLKRGHTVSFLGSCHPLSSMLKEVGAETHHTAIGLPPVTAWLAVSFFWRKNAMQKKLISAVQSLPHKPDVLVMLSLTEKILLTEWAASNGIKVFWIEHDRVGRWLTKNPWLGALKRASKKAITICVSELSRRMYTDLGFDAGRVLAIQNGIPLPHEGNVKTASESPTMRVGVIARLSPEKGIDVLLHAILNLPEIDLTIVGVGKEEAYVRSLIFEDAQRIGIERVNLVSHMADLNTFYQSLDVFVLPSSDHDPFGLVAAEAMAHGVATIVTDACGIAGYIEHEKDALIAKAGSSESMQSALRTLLDPAVRRKYAEEGKLTARMCFSADAMVDAYEDVFTRNS